MPDLNLNVIHASWLPLVTTALEQMDPAYLTHLRNSTDWLPGHATIFNAFSLPLPQTRYILFGESPYPRAESANGYAFWDNAVAQLWSDKGLSKPVNRATSLRNFMKMLLVADGHIPLTQLSQEAISNLPKQNLIKTAAELFGNMQNQGILLLNASLVLSPQPVQLDAKAWRPFMASLLRQVYQTKPDIQLILLGNIAKVIQHLLEEVPFKAFCAEHPYNISFIANESVQNFFGSFELLKNVNENK
jgi:uracil-DNA glycosylase